MAEEFIENTTSIMDLPQPSKEHKPRQRSINISDLFLTRFVTPWSRPSTLPAYTWRTWVLNQSVATDAKEFLISSLLSLDWKITPRDSNYREELQPTINYYTKLFTRGGNYPELGLDYSGLVEWVAGDLLDIPFGGAVELGRKGDSPDGRVMWIRPLDGGTLFPTLNKYFPVVQYYMGYDAVALPAHAIVRTFMSPIQNIWREGWGMAPPEKVYFALDLLNRGDKYYLNLLTDIPTTGILDLGDMEKDSAEEWVTAFRSFMVDQTVAVKIPVLYEHNNKVEFISFGKVPNDIMFDKITHKYAALMCAAYGISPQDIGLSTTTSSGETLAGSIRSQRQTKITGRARVKLKMKYFFDTILPPSLEFSFIDYDTEDMINLGRARLASATAFNSFQVNGNFSAQEIRSQAIQDGLFTINLPDEVPPEAKKAQKALEKNAEPEIVGNKKNPSQGGEGEVKSITFKAKPRNVAKVIDQIVSTLGEKIYQQFSQTSEDELLLMKSLVDDSIFSDGDELLLQATMRPLLEKSSIATFKFDGTIDELREVLGDIFSDTNFVDYAQELENNIKEGVNDFLGKAIVYTLNDEIFSFDGNVNENYNYIKENVQKRIEDSLPAFLESHVRGEFEKIVNKIRNEN